MALISSVAIPGAVNGTTSSAIDTTGATLLVATIGTYWGGAPYITDSKSNTWTARTKFGSTGQIELYYCENPTVGTGHTFTTVGSYYESGCAAAFDGTLTTPSYDGESGTGLSGSGTTIQPGSVTPSGNNELLILAVGCNSDPSTPVSSVDSGFTIAANSPGVPSVALGSSLAYKYQTTAAAENPTATYNSSAADRSASLTAFKLSGGAGGPAFIARTGRKLIQAVLRASVW